MCHAKKKKRLYAIPGITNREKSERDPSEPCSLMPPLLLVNLCLPFKRQRKTTVLIL